MAAPVMEPVPPRTTIVTMMNELERTDSRYGVVALCAAGGMGSATVIERV